MNNWLHNAFVQLEGQDVPLTKPMDATFHGVHGLASKTVSMNDSVQSQINRLQSDVKTTLRLDHLPEQLQNLSDQFVKTADDRSNLRLQEMLAANDLLASDIKTYGRDALSPGDRQLKIIKADMAKFAAGETVPADVALAKMSDQLKFMKQEIGKLKSELYLFEEAPRKDLETYFEKFGELSDRIETSLAQELTKEKIQDLGLEVCKWEMELRPVLESISNTFEQAIDPIEQKPWQGVKWGPKLWVISSTMLSTVGLVTVLKSQLIYAADSGNPEVGRALGVLSTSSFIVYNYLMSGFQGIVFKYSGLKEHQFGRMPTRVQEVTDAAGNKIKTLVENIRRIPSSLIKSFSNGGFKDTTNLMVFVRQGFIENTKFDLFSLNNDASKDERFEIKGLEITVKNLEAKAELIYKRLAEQSKKLKLNYDSKQLRAMAFDLALPVGAMEVRGPDILLDAAQDAGMDSGQADYVWHLMGLDGGERTVYSGFVRHFEKIKKSDFYKKNPEFAQKCDLYFNQFQNQYSQLTVKNIYDVDFMQALMEKFRIDAGLPAATDAAFWKNHKQAFADLNKVPLEEINQRIVELVTEGAKIESENARKFVKLLGEKAQREIGTKQISDLGNHITMGLADGLEWQSAANLIAEKYTGDANLVLQLLKASKLGDINESVKLYTREDRYPEGVLNQALDLAEAIMYKFRSKEDVGVPGFFAHKFQYLSGQHKLGVLTPEEKVEFERMKAVGADIIKSSAANLRDRFIRYANYDFKIANIQAAQLIDPWVKGIAKNGLSGSKLTVLMNAIAAERSAKKQSALSDDALRLAAFETWRDEQMEAFSANAQEVLAAQQQHQIETGVNDGQGLLTQSQIYLLADLLKGELDKVFEMQLRVAKGLVRSISENDVALHQLSEQFSNKNVALEQLTGDIRKARDQEEQVLTDLAGLLMKTLPQEFAQDSNNVLGKPLAVLKNKVDAIDKQIADYMDAHAASISAEQRDAINADLNALRAGVVPVFDKPYQAVDFFNKTAATEYRSKDFLSHQLQEQIGKVRGNLGNLQKHFEKMSLKNTQTEATTGIADIVKDLRVIGSPTPWREVDEFLLAMQGMQLAFYERGKEIILLFTDVTRNRWRNNMNLVPEQLTTQLVDYLFGEGDMHGFEPLNSDGFVHEKTNEVIFTEMIGEPLTPEKFLETQKRYQELMHKKAKRDGDVEKLEYVHSQKMILDKKLKETQAHVDESQALLEKKLAMMGSVKEYLRNTGVFKDIDASYKTASDFFHAEKYDKAWVEELKKEATELVQRLSKGGDAAPLEKIHRRLIEIDMQVRFQEGILQKIESASKDTSVVAQRTVAMQRSAVAKTLSKYAIQQELKQHLGNQDFESWYKKLADVDSKINDADKELEGAHKALSDVLEVQVDLEKKMASINKLLEAKNQKHEKFAEIYAQYLYENDGQYKATLKELKKPEMLQMAWFERLSAEENGAHKNQVKALMLRLLENQRQQVVQVDALEKQMQLAGLNTEEQRLNGELLLAKQKEFQELDHKIGLYEKTQEALAALELDRTSAEFGNLKMAQAADIKNPTEEDYARWDALRKEIHLLRGKLTDMNLLPNLASFPLAMNLHHKLQQKVVSSADFDSRFGHIEEVKQKKHLLFKNLKTNMLELENSYAEILKTQFQNTSAQDKAALLKYFEENISGSLGTILKFNAQDQHAVQEKKSLFTKLIQKAIATDQKVYGLGKNTETEMKMAEARGVTYKKDDTIDAKPNAVFLKEITNLAGKIFDQHQQEINQAKTTGKVNFYSIGTHYDAKKWGDYGRTVFFEFMDWAKRWGGYKANNLESETGATVYEQVYKVVTENIREVAENQALDVPRNQTLLNINFCDRIQFVTDDADKQKAFADSEEIKFRLSNGFLPDQIIKDMLTLRMAKPGQKALGYQEAKQKLISKWTSDLLTQGEKLKLEHELANAKNDDERNAIQKESDRTVELRRSKIEVAIVDHEAYFKEMTSDALITSYTGWYLGQFSALFMLAGKLPQTPYAVLSPEAIEDYLRPAMAALAKFNVARKRNKNLSLSDTEFDEEELAEMDYLMGEFKNGRHKNIDSQTLRTITMGLKGQFSKKGNIFNQLTEYEREQIEDELGEKLRWLHNMEVTRSQMGLKEKTEKVWATEDFLKAVKNIPAKSIHNQTLHQNLLGAIKDAVKQPVHSQMSFKDIIANADPEYLKLYTNLENDFQLRVKALETKFRDERDYEQYYYGAWYTFSYQMQPEALVSAENNANGISSYFSDNRPNEQGEQTVWSSFGRSAKLKMNQGKNVKVLREYLNRPGWRQNDAIDFEQWNARKRSNSRMPAYKRERGQELEYGVAIDKTARILNVLVRQGEIKLGGAHPSTEAEILKTASVHLQNLEMLSNVRQSLQQAGVPVKTYEQMFSYINKLTAPQLSLLHSTQTFSEKINLQDFKNRLEQVKKTFPNIDQLLDFSDFAPSYDSKKYAIENGFENTLNHDLAFQYVNVTFPQHLLYEIDTDNGLFESRVGRYRNEFKLAADGKVARKWQVGLGGMQKIQSDKTMLSSMQNWNGGTYQRVMGRVFSRYGQNGFMGCYLTMSSRNIDYSKRYVRMPKLLSGYMDDMALITGERGKSRDWLYYTSFGMRSAAAMIVVATAMTVLGQANAYGFDVAGTRALAQQYGFMEALENWLMHAPLASAAIITTLKSLWKWVGQERNRAFEGIGSKIQRHWPAIKETIFHGIKTFAVSGLASVLIALSVSMPMLSGAMLTAWTVGFSLGMIGPAVIKAARTAKQKSDNRKQDPTELPKVSGVAKKSFDWLKVNAMHKGPWILAASILAASVGATPALPALGTAGLIILGDLALSTKFGKKDQGLLMRGANFINGRLNVFNRPQFVKWLHQKVTNYENGRLKAGLRLFATGYLALNLMAVGTGVFPLALAGLFAMLIMPRLTRVMRAAPGKVNPLVGNWFTPTTGYMALTVAAAYGVTSLLFPPAAVGAGVVVGVVSLAGGFSALAAKQALKLKDVHTRKKIGRIWKKAWPMIAKPMGGYKELKRLGYENPNFRTWAEQSRIAQQQWLGPFAVGVNRDSEDLATTFMVLMFGFESAFHENIDGLSGSLGKMAGWIDQMKRWRGGGIAMIQASNYFVQNYSQVRDRDALRMLFKLTFNAISLPRAALMFATGTFLLSGGMAPSFIFMDSAFFKDGLAEFVVANNLSYATFLRMFYGLMEGEGAAFPVVRNVLNSNEVLSSIVTRDFVARGIFGDSAPFIATESGDRPVRQDFTSEIFTPNYLFSATYGAGFAATGSFLANSGGALPAWFMASMLYWTANPMMNFFMGQRELGSEGSLPTKDYTAIAKALDDYLKVLTDGAGITHDKPTENEFMKLNRAFANKQTKIEQIKNTFNDAASQRLKVNQRDMEIKNLKEYIHEQENTKIGLKNDVAYSKTYKVRFYNRWRRFGKVFSTPVLWINNEVRDLVGLKPKAYRATMFRNINKKLRTFYGLKAETEYERLDIEIWRSKDRLRALEKAAKAERKMRRKKAKV